MSVFVDLSNSRDSAAMSQLVKDKLISHSNIKGRLVMQIYYGAAVMSGLVGGIQARVRQEYPLAYFVHGTAQRLNLALCQSVSSITSCYMIFNNHVIYI